jgi:hypothetical protein
MVTRPTGVKGAGEHRAGHLDLDGELHLVRDPGGPAPVRSASATTCRPVRPVEPMRVTFTGRRSW